VTAPLVSVLLPVFNRAGWVGRAIESVLAQTHPAVELIVVDDGSTDETPAVIRGFSDKVRMLRQPNLGPYAARNLALGHARGDLVAFMDSDDRWHPDKLARQLPLLARPAVGLVYADAALVEGGPDAARPLGRSAFANTLPARGRVLEAFVRGNFVPTCTVLARRQCLEEIGGFESGSRLSADYLAWYRIARRHELDYVAAPLADYTVHAGGISHDLGKALAARIALFEAELERSDGRERAIVRRILFTLGLHLALATLRGRSRSVSRPWARARSAIAGIGLPRGVGAFAAFAGRQVALRANRAWR
jgi:glycosyltransferase involved in cell wall biosynthesis